MSAHHIVPVKIYVAVFLALMLGTAVTVAVAYLDLGFLNNVVMLGIAVTKATLVVLYFMHVRYSTRMIPIVVLAGVLWLLILFGLTMQDYVTRGWLGAGAPWPAPWSR